MRKLQNHLIGVAQGSRLLFSDFEDGGAMWTGRGPREVRLREPFPEPFKSPPAVHASLSMFDIGEAANHRADLSVGAIDVHGFELVFRTWGDTRIARVRADWMAIGEVRADDEWDV
ncbi:H-type lectin domain-containing protein [Jannaschia sp. W003]|uniref:H-type lectin domain-containing protein n=1 Tax=Jannaschia sp. W003 TaxID=2867012 RepID=UPI0021A6EC40|nr:H-type lectin domain-containing protein [Jannaschia sp. W003]UWQ22493.1 H-type lectin domain-containing protein [Jannaschia sp. W003]